MAKIDIVVKDARIVTEDGIIEGAIGVDKGQIAFLGSTSERPPASRTIDAQGNYAIPGLIDSHVHLRGGRTNTKEHAAIFADMFPTESLGAVHGGVTTMGVFSWSDEGQPLSVGIEAMREVGSRTSLVDFFPHAVITRERHLAEMSDLAHRFGCWSFKHFFNANKPRGTVVGPSAYSGIENELLFRSLEIIKALGPPALGMAHCEEQDIAWELEDRLRAAGRNDLRAWTEARPAWVDHLRMRIAYDIARAVGAPLYVVHVVAADGVDLLAQARERGMPYWGETCPHYLTHTAEMEDQIGCWGRVANSLKFEPEQERLWQGIREGSISNMGTDHSPFPRAVKEAGGGKHNNVWGARSGINGGLEHWLPVMMTHGVHAGRITIQDLVRVCSTNNARVFGLYPRKGTLRPGSDADIVLIDPDREETIGPDFYRSGADWSIYYDWKMRGLPRLTMLRGKVLLEDFKPVAEAATGKYLIPSFEQGNEASIPRRPSLS